MTRKFFFFSFFLIFTLTIAAQTSNEDLPVKDLETQAKILVKGDLKTGNQIPLEWAASSQMACFPATRFNEYQGNHLFYRVTLPAQSEMEITVTPKNKKHRINVYALRLGSSNQGVPPNLPSAISCEAAYPIYAGTPNYNIAATSKTVEYMSIRKAYTIVIGVAGAVGVTEGEFELAILTNNR